MGQELEPINAILGGIERLARDPKFDPDKFAAIIKYQIQLIKMRQRSLFDEAFVELKTRLAELKIPKSGYNPTYGSHYSTLADLATIDTFVVDHGFALSFGERPCPTPGLVRMGATLTHTAGGKRRYHKDAPAEGANRGRSALQAAGSTDTYLKRYLKAGIFDLTGTDEYDQDDRKPPATAQISEAMLNAMIDDIKDIQNLREGYSAYKEHIKALDEEAQDRVDKRFKDKAASFVSNGHMPVPQEASGEQQG